ncbi:MAG: M23 family metallopeptidase [Rhodothermales bacterium]
MMMLTPGSQTVRGFYHLVCAAGLGLVLASGCANERVVRGVQNLHQTPYDAYVDALRTAHLDGTALGRTWIDAGSEAVSAPLAIESPYQEVGFLDPREVTARAYQIHLYQGQRLDVQIALQASDSAIVFVDLFEVPEDSSAGLRHVAIADSTNRLIVEAREDLSYVLRLQPELLRGGRYTVDITVDASLGFPVAGRGRSAVQSLFGADRDGGRRSHEGVDIFAPRGTPVVAISPGYVARIDETTIGGKVIWVRDAMRNQAYYYAHLDRQLVEPNTRVEAGDTLGTVGNTGNAISTPSHLHFGIYTTRRAVDPLPYINPMQNAPLTLAADTSRLGEWARVTASLAFLRAAPQPRADKRYELPRNTALRLLAGSGDWYRVALPDGEEGFILAHQIETASEPIRSLEIAEGLPIRRAATSTSYPIDSVRVASQLPVFGEFGGYLGVTAPSGRTGWIEFTE